MQLNFSRLQFLKVLNDEKISVAARMMIDLLIEEAFGTDGATLIEEIVASHKSNKIAGIKAIRTESVRNTTICNFLLNHKFEFSKENGELSLYLAKDIFEKITKGEKWY